MAESVFARAVNADGSTGVWMRGTYVRGALPALTRTASRLDLCDPRVVSQTSQPIDASLLAGSAQGYLGLLRLTTGGARTLNLSDSATDLEVDAPAGPEFVEQVERDGVFVCRLDNAAEPAIAIEFGADVTDPYAGMVAIGYANLTPDSDSEADIVAAFIAACADEAAPITIALADQSHPEWDLASLSFLDSPPPLPPDAAAPAVTIGAQADIDEDETAALGAAIAGGTYDTLAYQWSDGGAGGSFSAQAANTVYTPPDVSSDTSVTVTCTVTASGTGTNAADGTADTSGDTESFTVRFVAPPPPLPPGIDAAALRMLVPLITIGSGTDIARLAGHPVDIEVGGETYAGGKAIGISPIEETEGTPDNRASISLSLAEEADYLEYGVDPGPLPVEIGFARSDDSGATWTALSKKHKGRMSLPSIEGRELSFEIETLRGDVDRGGELVWSDESQRAEFLQDNGLGYVRPIAAGDIEVAWPPIVPFVLAAGQILDLFGWAL